MDTIFIIAAAFALFFAVLTFNKPERSLPDTILSIWFSVLTFHFIFFYLQRTGAYIDYPHLLGVTDSFAFLYGPLHFLYVTTYISEKPRFKKTYLLHMTPFFINTVIYLPFYMKDASQKIDAYFTQVSAVPYLVEIGVIFKLILLPTYLILSWILLKRHKKNIQNYFSSKKEKDLLWLKNFTAGVGIFWLIILTNIMLEQLVFDTPVVNIDESIMMIFQSVGIVILGYFGFKQGTVFSSLLPKENTVLEDTIKTVGEDKTTKYKKSGLRDEDADQHLEKLLHFMKTDKPYLNSEVTIGDISKQAGISRHAVTQIINQKLGKNFYQFVNEYRVEETKRRIIDPENANFTLLAIGFDSGFNSKSTFNTIFKNVTDMTPSQFRKNISS